MLNPVVVLTTYKGPEAFTAACLANLMATWHHDLGSGGVPLDLLLARGTDPAAQLHRAVHDLREQNAPRSTSGILSLEHDHGFTPQDLQDLLAVAKDWPGAIVGGLYYQRQADLLVGERKEPIKEWENEPTPAYFCSSVGLGFTFIPWSVFDHIPEPWFDPQWMKDEAGKWTRESHDQAFCREASMVKPHPIVMVGVILRTLTHLHEVPPRGVAFKKETK